MSKTLVERCKSQLGITLNIRESVKAYIVDKAFQPKYGARPLRRMIQDKIEDALAEEILAGTIRKGDTVDVGTKNKEVHFSVRDRNEEA